jgi:hypothetical protein
VYGKVNFTNLSRYSDLSERTYRRQYHQLFDFVQFNQHTIAEAIPATADTIAAIDCSFVPKSGKTTYGLDWFYNGSASRSEKGLEISVIAVIDVSAHRGYTLSVQQTPPTPVSPNPQTKGKGKRKRKHQGRQTVSQQTIEQVRELLEQLPEKPEATPMSEPSFPPELSRVDSYLNQLKSTYPHLPMGLRYLVGDGFYSKQKFVDGVVALTLHLISKLRIDADLRYLYTGSQKPKGRPRKYDGKVDLGNLSRFTLVDTIEPHLTLYTVVVWHVSLKRKIRLALLVDTHNPNKTGYVLLFSTHLELDAKQILTYYKARFQIEFIFRDALAKPCRRL